jgi:hypothetical protein
MKSIKELIEVALASTSNTHAELCIGAVTQRNANDIKQLINQDLVGAERYLDTSTIRHIINNHGSVELEAKRGQIAITFDDIEAIPQILRSYNKIKYIGKNRLQHDMFEYHTKSDVVYIIVEAVRIRKWGNRMYIQTMYKRKK